MWKGMNVSCQMHIIPLLHLFVITRDRYKSKKLYAFKFPVLSETQFGNIFANDMKNKIGI